MLVVQLKLIEKCAHIRKPRRAHLIKIQLYNLALTPAT
jgi:hypothetical protein